MLLNGVYKLRVGFLFLLLLLLIPLKSNAVWAPGSNYVQDTNENERAYDFSLAVPAPLIWSVWNIDLVEFNTFGGYDIGYKYLHSYDFGEGVDVETDGYSNPQLITRADLNIEFEAWLEVTSPGFYMDFYGKDPINIDIVAFLTGANVNIDEKIGPFDVDLRIPFKQDVGLLGEAVVFETGIYNGDYSKTTYVDLADIVSIPGVDATIGVARGLKGGVGFGFSRIEYFNGSGSLGSQTTADQGVSVTAFAGQNINLTSRKYIFAVEPAITAGVALMADFSMMGWEISAYYPGPNEPEPALIDATINLPLEVPVTVTPVQPLAYPVPTGVTAVPETTTYAVSVSSGVGRVISTPVGIDCNNGSGNCSAMFPANNDVHLSVISPNNFNLLGWTGDCIGSGQNCTLSLNANKTTTVLYRNTMPPVLTVPADITVSAPFYNSSVSVDLGQATAIDDIDGRITAVASKTGPFKVGDYYIDWSATDSSGNTGHDIQKVSVNAPANAMLFISETVTDGTVFQGGEPFNAAITVKNVGTETWGSGHCLQHYSGIALSGINKVCVTGSVAPGQLYTFVRPMQAPSATTIDATYKDIWRLYVSAAPVSSDVWVEITVQGIPNGPDYFITDDIGPDYIDLTWSNQPAETTYYRLYRSETAQGVFGQVYSGANIHFSDSGLSPNTTYYYKVRGCSNSEMSTCSSFSNVLSATTINQGIQSDLISSFSISPTSVEQDDIVQINATIYNPGGIAYLDRFQFVFLLSEDTTMDASDNLLYQASQGQFTLPYTSQQSFNYTHTISGSQPAGPYSLLACVIYKTSPTSSEVLYCQDRSLTVAEQPLEPPDAPYKPYISYNQGETEVDISWNSSSGGSYYRLYRSTSSSGSYSQIYSGSGFSFIDTGLSLGQDYFYRLKSCDNNNEMSCSDYSEYSNVSLLLEADHDFYPTNLKVSLSGAVATLEATQRYSGTSVDNVLVNLGFYLSSDTVCSVNDDTFLGDAESGLKASDLLDGESITVTLPSETNSGTWYVCAIADHDNRYTETSESNNSISITVATDVPAPSLKTKSTISGGNIQITWQSVPGTVSYRLYRKSSLEQDLDSAGLIYVGNGSDVNYYWSDNVISECSEYYYQLLSCNGTNSQAICSSSPIVKGYTLPNKTPTPTVTPVGKDKIVISWDEVTCAEKYYVARAVDGETDDDYVYYGDDKEFVDQNRIFPTASYTYRVGACTSEDASFGNVCALSSDTVTVSPLQSNDDPYWQEHSLDENIAGRTSVAIVEFKNKLWAIGGYQNSENKNDVWSSDDGIIWENEIENAAFSPRRRMNVTVHDNKIFLVGGILSDGSYSSEIWSSADGVNWQRVIETSPFVFRLETALVSFNGKLWLIGGVDANSQETLSDIWTSVDGSNWTLVTSAAQFGKRRAHAVYGYNGKLWLLGGMSLNFDGINDDLWSSVDGINWEQQADFLPFGGRAYHSIVNYAGKLWMLDGIKKIIRYVTTTPLEITYGYDWDNEVWSSADGVNWHQESQVTKMETNSTVFETYSFNNQIIARGTQTAGWTATYGYVPAPAGVQLLITGSPVSGQILSTDIDPATDPDGIIDATFQWYLDGNPIVGAENASYWLDGVQAGNNVSVHMRFKNTLGDMHTIIAEVVIEPNPIHAFFQQETASINYSVNPYTFTLANMESAYEVVFSSSDDSVIQVSNDNNQMRLTSVGIGTAKVTAVVSDTEGNTRSSQLQVIVGKGDQNIGFNSDVLSKNETDSIFLLLLAESGDGSGMVTYGSNNNTVATINSSGVVYITGAGNVTLTVTKAADANFNQAQASIILHVSDDDYDNDGISDDNDNCMLIANTSQANYDGINDGGDACDTDDDNDGIADALDAFPLNVYESWDTDKDGIGNNADMDDDGDGVNDSVDSFPFDVAASKDGDNDGYPDEWNVNNSQANSTTGLLLDLFPNDGSEWSDQDGDGIGDNGDNCPAIPNLGQDNVDNDTFGDICDNDNDNDGYSDSEEKGAGTDPLDPNDFPYTNRALVPIINFLLMQ